MRRHLSQPAGVTARDNWNWIYRYHIIKENVGPVHLLKDPILIGYINSQVDCI